MDKEKKELIKILSVPALFFIVPVVILAVFSLSTHNTPDTPPWDGVGDWSACAAIATVSPDEALHIVSRSTNLSNAELAQRHATIQPVYVNGTGAVFDLRCSGGISVGDRMLGLPEYPTSSGSHYAWAVSIDHPGTLCMPEVGYVEWQTRQQNPQYVSPC